MLSASTLRSKLQTLNMELGRLGAGGRGSGVSGDKPLISPYDCDKAKVLQEARAFSESPLDPRKCCHIITKILYLLWSGEEPLTTAETSTLFFGVTRLFQSSDDHLRRMIYMLLKELPVASAEAFIVTSSLTKDLTSGSGKHRANAVRVLSRIVDPAMAGQIERYLKTAVVDKNTFVASSALVCGINLFSAAPEVVRRWGNEIQGCIQHHSTSGSSATSAGGSRFSGRPGGGIGGGGASGGSSIGGGGASSFLRKAVDASSITGGGSSSGSASSSAMAAPMVQLHALVLLHRIKASDPLALQRSLCELVHSFSKSPVAECFLLRYIKSLFGQELESEAAAAAASAIAAASAGRSSAVGGAGGGGGNIGGVGGGGSVSGNYLDSQTQQQQRLLLEYMESCMRHRHEMVMFEAARGVCELVAEAQQIRADASSLVATTGGSSSSTSSSGNTLGNLLRNFDLSGAVTVLQILLSSPKPVIRFAAIREAHRLAQRGLASTVARCNSEIEPLLNDPNRSTATLAFTTLLKTGQEGSVERLLKQISSFSTDVSDAFRLDIVQAVLQLCLQYPNKHKTLMGFLGSNLREEGSLELKTCAVDALIRIVRLLPQAQELGLLQLCEFIEDCEYPSLSTSILAFLGDQAPTTSTPSKFIRFIYNRLILENAGVRAAGVDALAKIACRCPSLLPDVLVLLEACINDNDDEVRDRANLYYVALQQQLAKIQSASPSYSSSFMPGFFPDGHRQTAILLGANASLLPAPQPPPAAAGPTRSSLLSIGASDTGFSTKISEKNDVLVLLSSSSSSHGGGGQHDHIEGVSGKQQHFPNTATAATSTTTTGENTAQQRKEAEHNHKSFLSKKASGEFSISPNHIIGEDIKQYSSMITTHKTAGGGGGGGEKQQQDSPTASTCDDGYSEDIIVVAPSIEELLNPEPPVALEPLCAALQQLCVEPMLQDASDSAGGGAGGVWLDQQQRQQFDPDNNQQQQIEGGQKTLNPAEILVKETLAGLPSERHWREQRQREAAALMQASGGAGGGGIGDAMGLNSHPYVGGVGGGLLYYGASPTTGGGMHHLHMTGDGRISMIGAATGGGPGQAAGGGAVVVVAGGGGGIASTSNILGDRGGAGGGGALGVSGTSMIIGAEYGPGGSSTTTTLLSNNISFGGGGGGGLLLPPHTGGGTSSSSSSGSTTTTGGITSGSNAVIMGMMSSGQSVRMQQQQRRAEVLRMALGNIISEDALGPLLHSSLGAMLTEKEAEYAVEVVKHFFPRHLVFEFHLRNTVETQILENVCVKVTPPSTSMTTGTANTITTTSTSPTDDRWAVLGDTFITTLAYNATRPCYVLLQRPAKTAAVADLAMFPAVASYIVKEAGDDIGYEDEYPVEHVILTIADYMAPKALRQGEFQLLWHAIEGQGGGGVGVGGGEGSDHHRHLSGGSGSGGGSMTQEEAVGKFSLNFRTLDAAVIGLIETLNMAACEKSDIVDPHKASHTLLLSGTFLGTTTVISKAMLIMSPEHGCLLKLQVRSENAAVARTLLQAFE